MALTATQSASIGIEPYQVGDQIKLKCTVSYLDPTFTEVDYVIPLQPQGLWNGLVPLIYKLQSGTFPGYQIGGEGPQPKIDLSRIVGGLLPSDSWLDSPPPTVDWPYSRRTFLQHAVDAGELDESGEPLPAGMAIPVRPPSYSGPYATNQTETENDINAAALAAYVPPPLPPVISSLTPATGPAAGPTVITIAGTGFLAGATVKVGSTTGIVPTTITATSITVTIPSPAITPPATYPVSVISPNTQTSNSMNFVST